MDCKYSCTYCEYRHGGCDHTDDEAMATYDSKPCGDFKLGSCYSCVVLQSGQEAMNNLCDEAFFPSRCKNFKLGIEKFQL